VFNPTPPKDPASPRPEPLKTNAEKPFLSRKCRRILGFAFKRGLLLAVILGGPLGLMLGWFANTRVPAFLDDPFAGHGDPVLFWTIATIAVFFPCMMAVCAIAIAVEEITDSMARSSRRTVKAIKKGLERRFDSHL